MKIYTTSQIKALDAYTILHEPIASIDLMERASQAFVAAFREKIPQALHVVVLAGPGNNGGDALAVARLLSETAHPVEVFLYNPGNKLSVDCETNRKRILQHPAVVLRETTDFSILPVLDENCVVVDGLFGSGLNKPLSGGYLELVKYLNDSPATVVSIDIPSGLFGEDNTGNDPEGIVQADWTLTFQSPKLSFLLPDNARYTGHWTVVDIQLHPEALESTQSPFLYTEQKDIAPLLKKRGKFAHKGNLGHALLIAGSYGKMGAAVLAAKACLRTGVGLLSVSVPDSGVEIMQISVPEAMVVTDSQPDYDAVGVGPGIGTEKEMAEKLLAFFRENKKPMVLDADALNILSMSPAAMSLLPPGSILTPHPKEFDRLAGVSISASERLHKAMDLSVRLQSYIVLKGAYTAICTPEGRCFFNSTGNPGMATAGSGDVLTGMILSLLAQGYRQEEAAKIAVYVHGMSGDLLVGSGIQSEESLMAGDLVEAIGKCFHSLRI